VYQCDHRLSVVLLTSSVLDLTLVYLRLSNVSIASAIAHFIRLWALALLTASDLCSLSKSDVFAYAGASPALPKERDPFV